MNLNPSETILTLTEEELTDAISVFYQRCHPGVRFNPVLCIRDGDSFQFHTAESVKQKLREVAEKD